MKIYHFIRDYYDPRDYWSVEEKKSKELAVRLKEAEASQKMVETSHKHFEVEMGWLKEELSEEALEATWWKIFDLRAQKEEAMQKAMEVYKASEECY